jgi:hypothetical protein
MDLRSRKACRQWRDRRFRQRDVANHLGAFRRPAAVGLRCSALLAEHAGRLVTKEELMDALRSGLVITDDNIV